MTTFFKMFFSRPTPIGGRELHIALIREEGGGRRREEEGGGTLSSTNREPDPVTGP